MANASRFRRSIPLVVILLFLLLPTGLMASWWHESRSHRGRKYKPLRPTAKITVTVMSEQFHKPIDDASVIFHSTHNNRPDGYMQLPTGQKGNATITVIPIGDTMVLQVIAPDYQTFGQSYKVDKKTMHIRVMLLPPQHQFSDFRPRPTGQVGDGGKGTTEPSQFNQNGSAKSHSSSKKK